MDDEARRRVRELMAQTPAQRPPDWVNPLEKIEQLLTCPICLDRYKQPKLLPCQHTFCHPCLESCADTLHHALKCPECRAEHKIPYDGVKSFQPNYTLTTILDIHLQATPESAAQVEEYVHRYNLERCKVCEEKAECQTCPHCDRRACEECRKTHMDMLKRDMGRLVMQVKRLSNRITEASDGLSKGIELLSLNCETTKQEVQEYFHRHIRELKKREENFLGEIEIFQSAETRLMGNLRDVLEIESSNMSEAVARLEAALKGEYDMDDTEIVRYKNIFTEGLEYLRNFSPDADELFCKKLRFTVDDAARLPGAIQTFGEITVMYPGSTGRYDKLEASYVPRMISSKIGLESDHFRIRSTDDRNAMDLGRNRFRETDSLTEHSLRYRRRQQIEEESWNRVRGIEGEPRERSIPGKSPWSRPPDETPTKPQNNTNSLQTTSAKNLQVSSKESPSSSTSTSPRPPSPKGISIPVKVEQSNNEPELETKSKVTIRVEPKQEPKVEVKSETATKQIEKPPTHKPPLPRQPSSQEEVEKNENGYIGRRSSRPNSLLIAEPSTDKEEDEDDRPRTARFRLRMRASSITRQESNEERETPIPITHYPGEHEGTPGSPRDRESSPAEIPDWLARRRARQQRSRTNPDLYAQFTSTRVQQLLAEREQKNENEKLASINPSASVQGLDAIDQMDEVTTRRSGAPYRARTKSTGHRDSSTDTGRGWRSRGGRPKNVFGRKGGGEGELNWPRGVTTLPGGHVAVCDSSNHRVCVFTATGEPLKTFGGYGTGAGELDSCAGIASGRGRQLIVTDRYNHRVCVFDSEGRLERQWGGHGPANGRFNNPWGVAVDDLGTIYVCDKDNHRVQMFDKNGVFVGKFGTHGSAEGQLNCPLFVAVSRINHTVYVTDSSNHRVNTYDMQGKFLFSFGQEGFQGGQFKSPRGIAIDNQGSVIVVDSGNNRVQVFTADGDFLVSFGTWGAGAGQLKGAEDVCLLNDAIVVSDRENHRIQIF
ncbi:unnamed protein product, partial [Mesorhabditis belari]|uniref:RING-type domain-containing protein n=1 Tax=Mesorhabditis belari TaxID=2138241 RepID=A0AAF3EA31_9BILA